jgi:hypothetical protein
MTIDPLDLGTVTATPAALEVIAAAAGDRPAHELMLELVGRHAAHDWGDVDADDRRANTRAIIEGSRVLSSYQLGDQHVWVVTEAESDSGTRACTTLLLPSDY